MFEHEQAQIRPELLVEVVLDLKRAAAVGWIVREELGLRVAALELPDDERGVADGEPVELQDREGGTGPEPPGDLRVPARDRRAADVREPLVVERLARLLVVVGDLEMPQNRRAPAPFGRPPAPRGLVAFEQTLNHTVNCRPSCGRLRR